MQWNQFYTTLDSGNPSEVLSFDYSRYYIRASVSLPVFGAYPPSSSQIHIVVTLKRGGVTLGTITMDATTAAGSESNDWIPSVSETTTFSLSSPFESVPLSTPADYGSSNFGSDAFVTLYSSAFRLIPDFYSSSDRQIEVELTTYTQYYTGSGGSSYVESTEPCQVAIFASSDPFPNTIAATVLGSDATFNAPSITWTPTLLGTPDTVTGTYRWRHGDGSDYQGTAPHTHTYATGGVFAARVIAFDNQYGWAEGGGNVTITEDTSETIGAICDPLGPILTAIKDGSDVKVYKFPSGASSRVLMATVTGVKNPVLRMDERGRVFLQTEANSGGDIVERVSTDLGRSLS